MTHQDKGKYFQKHPEGTTVREDLKREILKQAKDNNISCKAAEVISQNTGAPLGEIGIAIDMLNINLTVCQLGLFGFDDKQKRTPAAKVVAPELEKAIRQALVNERLSCLNAWNIAEKSGIKRLEICAACEKLGIKIKPCQLGAF